MASIEITLRDDNGNVLDGGKRRYELNFGKKNFDALRFDDIERGICDLRKVMLADITAEFLKKYKTDMSKK
ncbi:MAG: hypothetical protein HQL03_05560 [Nitrospirae bacterium]|nr:hypothetical protein [Nitrospirota bacterium]